MSSIESSKNKKRIDWVEYARGFAIFWVVVWHVNGGIVSSSLQHTELMSFWGKSWELWTFRFMPLFFLVSGIFVVRSIEKPVRTFILDKLRVLGYPYIIWSIITLLVGTIAVRYTNFGITIQDFPRIFYDPVLHYWFLFALLTMMLTFLIFYKLRLFLWTFLVFGIVLYIGGEITNAVDILYVLGQYCYFTVFFAIGIQFSSEILAHVEKASERLLSFATILSFLVLSIMLMIDVEHSWVWLQPFVAGLATIGAITFSELLARRNLLVFIKNWGQCSLEIYLAHVLFLSGIRIVMNNLLGIGNIYLHLVAGIVLGLYGPIILLGVCKRLNLGFIFAMPAVSARNQAQAAPNKAEAGAGS